MSLDNLFEWMLYQEEVETFRSGMWRNLREDFIRQNDECAICGGKKKLQVHHFYDVSNYPELELKWSNLVTLCVKSKYHKGLNCHLVFGHKGNWADCNYNLKEQIPMLRSLFYRGKNPVTLEEIEKYESQNRKNW